jgi:hypothetical protein
MERHCCEDIKYTFSGYWGRPREGEEIATGIDKFDQFTG